MFDFEVKEQEERKRKEAIGREVLSWFSVFVNDERARNLLRMWKEQSRTVIPIDSSVQAYAAKEFARRFIDQIEKSIEQLKLQGAPPEARPEDQDYLR